MLSLYRCRIEADPADAPVLLSNGNLLERGTCGPNGSRHYAVWTDPHPKPCYLFALVGGNLASLASRFRTMSGRDVDLTIYCEPGKEDRCAWAMDSLKRSMAWDEKVFGREYDLDVFNIVAVSDFNMGAMENKGLNVFNDRLILASQETATDAAFEAIEAVVAHEYFHNWTGNRITCRDWFQLCLKEGLTVFRDQEFSADERSRAVQRINDVRQLRARQFPEDAGPLAHPVRPESYIEINNFYTATVYEKGAELVRMLKTLVGDDAFAAGMDLYFARHDGDAATVEDFILCFEEASGRNLKQFRLWYTQAGTPELTYSMAHDAVRQRAELTLTQSQPPTPGQETKKPLQIPVRIGLLGPDGEERADEVVELTKPSQTFMFQDMPDKPTLSLLRGFSAPVTVATRQPEADLAFLIAHDTDPFARWQAANDFAMRLLTTLARANGDESGDAGIDAFADALRAPITNPALEPAFRAEFLKLPSETDVATELRRNVDPLAIHLARTHLRRRLALKLGRELSELHETLPRPRPYAPDAEQAGIRSLRNVALALLTARGRKEDREHLSQHYWSATNMTDQAFALALFADGNSRERAKVLEDFYDRWKGDHIVIDTWFAAQARAPANATLNRVRKLTTHPAYARTTPNKIRAIIGTFAMQNPVQFHRPDGAGHAFVADEVQAIDKFNPQVAARLLGAFSSWRQLEAARRKSAKAALVRIAKSPGLSRDSLEIATKMLD